MIRPLCIAAALTLAAAGAAQARGGAPTMRDCVSAGFFEITAVSSSIQPRSATGGGGGFAYEATIRARQQAERGFRVEFAAPGATPATDPQGYTLANRQSRTVTLGTTPAGMPRLSEEEIRRHIRVMCLA